MTELNESEQDQTLDSNKKDQTEDLTSKYLEIVNELYTLNKEGHYKEVPLTLKEKLSIIREVSRMTEFCIEKQFDPAEKDIVFNIKF
jgi:hypothetical protein